MTTGSFKQQLADDLRARGLTVETDVPIDRLIAEGRATNAMREFADGIASADDIESVTISGAGKTVTPPGGAARGRFATPTDEDPDAPYPVPPDAAFVDPDWLAKGGAPSLDAPHLEHIAAPDLAALAATIVARFPRYFRHTKKPFSLTVDYWWALKGGKQGGRPVLGTCALVRGTEKARTAATWKIVLNADALEGCTREYVENVLYHELRHTGLTEKLKPTLVPHDIQIFHGDYADYGFVREDTRQLRDTVQQRLFEDGEGGHDAD